MNAAAVATPCPQCGRDVPADAPEGLCPHCVAGVNFSEWLGGEAALEPTPAQRGSMGVEESEIASVAALFPQLQIESCLGRGGMGTVYKARQPRLNRWVALKVLGPGHEKDPRFAERFAREAQALARLRHPGIVAIHDFGEVRGRFYLVMEYVDGVTLRVGTRPSIEAVVGWVGQICDALQYAHEQGVVHRDIKPENLLLDAQGRVRLADFGIAKLLGAAAPLKTLTEVRSRVGTPHYMAPEQVERPASVDHHADIYSLGVVFYELLTGELPLGRFDSPSSRSSGCASLDEVVLRALQKDPERRFPTAAAMGAAAATAIARAPAERASGAGEADVEPEATRADTTRWMGNAFRVLAAVNLAVLVLTLTTAVALVALDRRGSDLGAPWSAMATWLQDDAQAGGRFALSIGLALALSGAWIMNLGARAMAGRESYRLALAACTLAMFVPPGCVIGFPLGWWGFVVLGRRTTQSTFQRKADATQPAPNLPGARFARAAAIALIPLVTTLATAEWMARRPALSMLLPLESVGVPEDGPPAVAREEIVPPVVVSTVPVAGETGVDPQMGEIRVTFSKPMKTEGSSSSQPLGDGQRNVVDAPTLLADGRTFVLPARLEPGRTYSFGINANAENSLKFVDRDGRLSVPYLIHFKTRGPDVSSAPNMNPP